MQFFFQVVLPVVARKKGLDGHYEEADGSPKPKKIEKPVAPVRTLFISFLLLLYILLFQTIFSRVGLTP